MESTQTTYDVIDTIYSSDKEFYIQQLDTGKQWLSSSEDSDDKKWEKITFDVWYHQLIGWLDIYFNEKGNGVWHFFECDPKCPAEKSLLYFAPMRVDITDRRGIFETVCEKILDSHKNTLKNKDRLRWKKPSVPIVQRSRYGPTHENIDHTMDNTQTTYGVKDTIYSSDKEFYILQLDTGKQWLSSSEDSDDKKWEKITFDVWCHELIGWLDIYFDERGNGVWHFFECDPKYPAEKILVHFEPMMVDITDRRGIFETVCENVLDYHMYTLNNKDRLKWKKPSVPIVQRSKHGPTHEKFENVDHTMDNTQTTYDVKDTIYSSDKEFYILQLDTGKQWLPSSKDSDDKKWEKITFDVWCHELIGWLDIYFDEKGNGTWHFFECDPKSPAEKVLAYFEPMMVDITDRRGIFETVCEKALDYHKYTLNNKDRLKWRKPSVPIVQRSRQTANQKSLVG